MKMGKQYDSNITAGALLFNEFKALKHHLTTDFLTFLKSELVENSIIGIPTLSARKRIFPELKRRFHSVSLEFWEEFNGWNEYTQRLALF